MCTNQNVVILQLHVKAKSRARKPSQNQWGVFCGVKADALHRCACGCSVLQDACAALLNELIVEVQCGQEGVSEQREDPSSGSTGFILAIDGRTLDWALQEDLRSSFLELSRKCKAVLCCRSTPLQKSKVVQLVRDHLRVMTLAVGEATDLFTNLYTQQWKKVAFMNLQFTVKVM